MGYVEAVGALWTLFIRDNWICLEEVGMSEQEYRPKLEAFRDALGSPSRPLTGPERLILLLTCEGVSEASEVLLNAYKLKTQKEKTTNEDLSQHNGTHRPSSVEGSTSKHSRSRKRGGQYPRI